MTELWPCKEEGCTDRMMIMGYCQKHWHIDKLTFEKVGA